MAGFWDKVKEGLFGNNSSRAGINSGVYSTQNTIPSKLTGVKTSTTLGGTTQGTNPLNSAGPLSYRNPTGFENFMSLGTMGAQAAGAYAGLKTQGTLQKQLDLLTEEKAYLSQEASKKSNFSMLGGLEGQQFRDTQNSINRASGTILEQDTATTLDRFGAKAFNPSALKAKV